MPGPSGSGAEVVLAGVVGSLVASLGTGVGAALVFLVRDLTARTEDVLLSSAAGIMLAATVFSLLIPGLEAAGERFESPLAAAGLVSLGLLCGAGLLWAIHRHVPHEHFVRGREGPDPRALRRMWLFVIAIALHNFPEGMAVGVGFGGGDTAKGVTLATGIALQNLPEGLAVAAALVSVDYSRSRAFVLAMLTGFVEPLGGLVGSAAIWLADPALPWTLGFAAGAMLFIISDEIIPETHRRGFETYATFALLGGFVVMMTLDHALA